MFYLITHTKGWLNRVDKNFSGQSLARLPGDYNGFLAYYLDLPKYFFLISALYEHAQKLITKHQVIEMLSTGLKGHNSLAIKPEKIKPEKIKPGTTSQGQLIIYGLNISN